MRKIIAIVIVCMIVGCNHSEPLSDIRSRSLGVGEDNTGMIIYGVPDKIYVIDSCEYIVIGWSHTQMMAHKGNCRYCKQRNQK